MKDHLAKLANIGGSALSLADPVLDADLLALAGSMADDLIGLLKIKNGFYAFESALHLFPATSSGDKIGLACWNSPDLWVKQYQNMAIGCLFFAEDIFGGQFCIKANEVLLFDPETGQLKRLATNLEEWARSILCDYDLLTGYPLAHEWQRANGQIADGMRLVPKIPFVLGGKFSVQNLYPIDATKAMRLRGSIAVQIRDLPDGTPIRLRALD
jgi:hypothetical protein